MNHPEKPYYQDKTEEDDKILNFTNLSNAPCLPNMFTINGCGICARVSMRC